MPRDLRGNGLSALGQDSSRSVSGSLRTEAKRGETSAEALVLTALRPTIRAAVAIKDYSKAYGDLDLTGLVNELSSQVQVAEGGDLNRAEYMGSLSTYLKLALRAQSQCRATWDTLAAMKNPPMMGYVKQANIAQGPQQVNNAATVQTKPWPRLSIPLEEIARKSRRRVAAVFWKPLRAAQGFTSPRKALVLNRFL